MRVIRMIAWREYMENVRTRGFWIGILLLPLMVIGIYLIQSSLARTSPTRYYLLIDQTGSYQETVESAIDLEYQRQVLQSFVDYLLDNRKERDLELTAANARTAADQLVDDVGSDEVAALNQWIESGGLDVALAMSAPYLREDAPPFQSPRRSFIQAPVPEGVDVTAQPEQIIGQLRPYLAGERRVRVDGDEGELFALILIPADVDGQILRPGVMPVPGQAAPTGVQYWSRNLADPRLPDAIERSLNNRIRDEAFSSSGLNIQLIRNIQRTRMPFSKLDPTASAGEEAVSMADTFRQYAPMGFVYFMFLALMQSVQYLLTNTIEEKSNRILEVLLASVTPNELLMGKMLGIGLSSLTTLAAWLLTLFLFLNFYDSAETSTIVQIIGIVLSSDLVPWFVFYCLAGYALYSGIFLAIGSLCNTLKEAQGMMVPIIVTMMIPVTITPFVVMDPNGSLFRTLSWIPPFTPFLMMNRAAANPPPIDLIGTSLLLLLSIFLVMWLSGRVFRQGLLRTGQPPRVTELLRMLRATH
ncbi:MAG: ABC transporter permease [Gammaproteobacteria bacterium]|nr:ABC transporter permease [Pseudomonadales bacterium]MCP5348162.1 ABC transporter permease [Pseudomonadales bacterium]